MEEYGVVARYKRRKMMVDPNDHKRWKHKWGLCGRRLLWRGQEKRIGTSKEKCQKAQDMRDFVTFAVKSVETLGRTQAEN